MKVPQPTTATLNNIQEKEGEKEPAKSLGKATTTQAPIVKPPPQDRKEDSGDSGYASGSSSKGLKQAQPLPSITLQLSSPTIPPPIISSLTTLSALGDSGKDSSGPSKVIATQEGLQVAKEDKLIVKTETEKGVPELKHKWSWHKGKSITRAMGRGFRGVLDALKDDGKVGDIGKGRAVAK
jgi:hypothetical protein